jgi:UDP-N-acetylmuramate--alanine ligase
MNIFEPGAKIHFVGIGGIGMSGLARWFHAVGAKVSGSDLYESETTQALIEEGIQVSIGHSAENLAEGLNLLIYSEAIPKNNPERIEADSSGIESMNYFEALGEVTSNYKVIAVAGTHGKTTTTAMLGLILIKAGLEPTVLVGSKLQEFDNKNLRMGAGELFVVEACEYRRNFLPLQPDLLGVLNIEFDHVDYFKDFDDYQEAFEQLAEQSKETVWPDDISEYEGLLGVPGHHNRMNAGMAAYLARRLGAPERAIADALKEYTGSWRRFEHKPSINGAVVIDDYAHHPTEILATLEAARDTYPERRIIAVFQPHQHSRTRELMDEFSTAFEEADMVIIPNIYAARDSHEDKATTAEDLVLKIAEHHDQVYFGDGLENTKLSLEEIAQDNDLILVMGAGDVGSITD